MATTKLHRVSAPGFALALAAAAQGCSSHYMPRPTSPRVATVILDGNPAFVRRGRIYRGGIFGGEIEEAVRGVPQAEAYARAYREGMTLGFVLTLVGAGVSIGGAATLPLTLLGGSSSSSLFVLPLALILGGFGMEMAGLGVTVNAVPRLYDAINAHNDAVDAVDPAVRIGVPVNQPAAAPRQPERPAGPHPAE